MGHPKIVWATRGPLLIWATRGVVDEHTNYVFGNATFTPSGALYSFWLNNGPGIYTQNYYSPRLQLVSSYSLLGISGGAVFFSKCFDYHLKTGGTFGGYPNTCTFAAGSGDNGNLYQVVNNLDSTRTQNFAYDTLNRISQAYTTGTGSTSWGEDYTIDAWGNLTNRALHQGRVNYEPLNATALTSNRLVGLSYDAAGNVVNSGNGSVQYDAENRIRSVAGITYTYDGDGKRVQKSSGMLYWTGADADTLSESDLAGNITSEYVYFNGMRVARRDIASGTVYYNLDDPLGTARMVVHVTGTTTAAVDEDADYYPYGGEIVMSGSSAATRYKFTGKERDSESGLDYFGARHYASNLGRYMRPDDPFADQHSEDPQSWNLYSYVRNNPLSFTDLNGHECVSDENGDPTWSGSGDTCEDVNRQNQEYQQSGQASATVTASYPEFQTGGLIAITPFQRGVVRAANDIKGAVNLLRDPRVSAYLSVLAFEADAGEEEELNPEEILFSQASVNNIEEIVASMQAKGWIGPGVDVVKLEDGTLVTLDNSRVFAAGQTGITVKAAVHDAGGSNFTRTRPSLS